MFNERAFISRVERANPDELASLLIRPAVEEEKALRAHFGDERYLRMHGLALKRKVTRSVDEEQKGNVVVIHGIMGAELSVGTDGNGDLTWVNAFRIIRGWLDRLRLAADGRSEANPKFTVTASSIMKRYYGEMILTLGENWNVKDFFFDWRKDIDLAADSLNLEVGKWFEKDKPFHIVAHSMGGLVARTFIKKYPQRWKPGNQSGRLIMLGTPNHGSFAIPQVMTGVESLVRKLARLDLRHNRASLLTVFNTFVGSYQMLPSPNEMNEIVALYDSGTYSKLGVSVSQAHLDKAKAHHEWLRDAVDPNRMIYVAGYNQPTFSGIDDWSRLDETKGYIMTRDGDGRVPHNLGLLKAPDGTQVPTYYIEEDHGNLSTNTTILAALSGLLQTGETKLLSSEMRPTKRAVGESQEELREEYEKSFNKDTSVLELSLGRMNARSVPFGVSRREDGQDISSEADEPTPRVISPAERKIEEAITHGFLAYRGDSGAQGPDVVNRETMPEDKGEIEIGLVYSRIEDVEYDKLRTIGNNPVDAISVGHYIGVQPQWAELALDRAISRSLLEQNDPNAELRKTDLILTQYTERGIIHGKLGQPFFMPDPRVAEDPANNGRLIAIAGMGEPGRFGMPELTVLVRELCWSLGRLKKVHLATVMIGSGEGNIQLRDGISAWLAGIRSGVAGSAFDKDWRLQRVTFVEYDPRKVIHLDALLKHHRDQESNFKIIYEQQTDEQIETLKEAAYDRARAELDNNWKKELTRMPRDIDVPPARVTLTHDPAKKTYRFGAITETASIPERDTVIDPKLIRTANDELAGEQSAESQLERGRFLEKLLMPSDLRKQLYQRAPLVMILDATTARIHWEMVAQPSNDTPASPRAPDPDGNFEYSNDFLGTSRGFTRQLRTTFAPPPEPPPPPQKVLKVLVVADPAEDAHLPGAEEEAVLVADLFESYNTDDDSSTRVEVTRLFGPIDATRTNVLKELMERPYHVLHFAGHCVFEWDGDPSMSGWIFHAKRRELLTANELNRVDRIPKFVFSNACESGITPDRAQDRDDRLAPSFAEAFFARGVANFVCTAWPVDDVAARIFAISLYSNLLGLPRSATQNSPSAVTPLPMHEAMRRARLAIAKTPNGRTTWGAYQHYGNPYFRLFYGEKKA